MLAKLASHAEAPTRLQVQLNSLVPIVEKLEMDLNTMLDDHCKAFQARHTYLNPLAHMRYIIEGARLGGGTCSTQSIIL